MAYVDDLMQKTNLLLKFIGFMNILTLRWSVIFQPNPGFTI